MLERFPAIFKRSALVMLVMLTLVVCSRAQQTRVSLWTEPTAAEVYLVASSSHGKGIYLGLSDKPLNFPNALTKYRSSLDLRIEKVGYHPTVYNLKVMALVEGAKLPIGDPIRLPPKNVQNNSMLAAVGGIIALSILVVSMAPKLRFQTDSSDALPISPPARPDSDHLIGQKVCGFKICSFVAKGGMGTVYLAKSLVDETQQAAIKIIDLQGQSEIMRERYFRELTLASQLHHPSVVRTWDYSLIEDRYLAIVMEWLPGIPLNEAVPGPIEPLEALALLKPVFDGLQFLHDRNIVHRDIKPGNIVLLENGTAKIIDFGLAKVQTQQNLTHTGNVVGTPKYMAPEQIKGGRDLGPTADQYALGTILLELITGKQAFPSQDAMAILYQKIQSEAPLAHSLCPKVPMTFSTELARMMKRNSKERFPSVVEAFQRLVEAV